MKYLIVIFAFLTSAKSFAACEVLFNGETEGTVGQAEIPLDTLDISLAKRVPEAFGDSTSSITWNFFPRGARMVVLVPTWEAVTRFEDAEITRTIALGDDGTVRLQVQRGSETPGPITEARISAVAARKLIQVAYREVHRDEVRARLVLEHLSRALPQNRIWPPEFE